MILSDVLKKALEEQAQLLSERSKQDGVTTDELCKLSEALASISRLLSV